jgi:hypothetical protein
LNGEVRVNPGTYNNTAIEIDALSINIVANISTQPPTLSLINPAVYEYVI